MSNLMRLQLVLSAVDKMSSVVDKAVNRAQARMRSLSGSAMAIGREGLAMGVGLGAAMALPIKEAVEFETGMANVRKVVGDLKDEKVFKEFTKDVVALGREIPLAYSEITDLVAAGGRMDIPKNELVAYTKEVAKMAIAFDAPAGEIGERMGKLAKSFDIPISKIGDLADAINYLDDNSISKGTDIIEVMARMSGTARQLGMSGEQTAALGSTFLTLGASAEVAATAGNAMLRELAIAEMQPKRFQKGLQAIGVDAAKLQKQMSVDPQGTLLGVLDKINKLPKDKQTAIGTLLFGKEYGDDAAKLAKNVGEYRRQIGLLSNAQLKGSMSREFETRMKTTAAQMKIFRNNISEIAITIGNAMLPALNSVMQAIKPYIDAFRDWAAANPELVAEIAKVVAVMAALSIATSVASFVFGGLFRSVSVGLSIFRFFSSGLVKTAEKTGWIIKAGRGLWKVLGVLGGALRWLGGIFMWVGRLFMANPIGLAITAIAGAVYLIYRYWEPLKNFFVNLWQGIKDTFFNVWEWIKGFASAFYEAGKNLLVQLWEGMKSMFARIRDGLTAFISGDVLGAIDIGSGGAVTQMIEMKRQEARANAGLPPLPTTGGGLAGLAILDQMRKQSPTMPQPVAAANTNTPTTNNQTVNFSPVINIQSAGGVEGFNVAMDKAKQDLARQLKEFQERQTRKSYQ